MKVVYNKLLILNDIKVTFLNENMQIRNKSMNNLFDII
jgi:hypothetical protein